MGRFLVVVQVILVVAGLGLGGYVGYRAFDLMGKDDTGQLQSYLVLAVLALVLVVAAGAVRPRHDVGAGGEPPGALGMSGPARQRMMPSPPPFQQPPGGYRPGGPATGPQPPVGPGGPHTGPQPKIGGQDQPFGGRTEQFPR
jgi:hypothetical protein